MWIIEAAVESGRRAAQVFEPGVAVLPQYRPRLLRALGRIDDALYRRAGPHGLPVLAVSGALAIVALMALLWSHGRSATGKIVPNRVDQSKR